MSENMTESKEFVDNIEALSRAKVFLGSEFLTWLWFSIENDSAKARFPDPNYERQLTAEFWIDDKVVLQATTGLSHEQILKGGDPSKSGEAAMALASGKNVRELKLGARIKPYGEFVATLKSEDMQPRSLKLPDTSDPANFSDPDLPAPMLRLLQTDVYLHLVQTLFTRFLKSRMKEGWEKEHWSDVKNWIKSRYNGQLSESGSLH